jgi:hypothetical protein
MPDYDAGFKIVARQAGRQLSRVAHVRCDAWEPIGDTVQATERLADRAFRARLGRQRFVVYFEAYTRWQKSAPWSILAKSGLLSERERLPTRSLVFVLLPQGYRRLGRSFRLAVAGAPTQQVWITTIRLWEEEPQRWWEDSPGLMALYPLCRHGKARREAVTYAAGKIVERASDAVVRADLLTTLSIFGKLVYPDLDVMNLIGREQMKESKFYQEILEEGAAEGDRKRARADILEVLEVRFRPERAAEFREVLQGITDRELLSELHRLAVRCRRLAEFRRALLSASPSS